MSEPYTCDKAEAGAITYMNHCTSCFALQQITGIFNIFAPDIPITFRITDSKGWLVQMKKCNYGKPCIKLNVIVGTLTSRVRSGMGFL